MARAQLSEALSSPRRCYHFIRIGDRNPPGHNMSTPGINLLCAAEASPVRVWLGMDGSLRESPHGPRATLPLADPLSSLSSTVTSLRASSPFSTRDIYARTLRSTSRYLGACYRSIIDTRHVPRPGTLQETELPSATWFNNALAPWYIDAIWLALKQLSGKQTTSRSGSSINLTPNYR